MSIADWLKEKIGMRGGIGRLTLDTLNAERIQLEETQRLVERDLDQIEQQRNELIQKGRSQTNPRQKLALARRIKNLDDASRSKDQQLAVLNQRLQIVGGLIMIQGKKPAPDSVLNNISTEELIVMVENASETGQFEYERFAEVLEEMDRAASWGGAAGTDPAIEAIMAEMDGGNSESAEPPAVQEKSSKRVDKFSTPDRQDPERI
jgi:hypothetical protein